MKWFLRFCFLAAVLVLPAIAHALTPTVSTVPPSIFKAPEFDLATLSGGLAVLVGAWWFLPRWRRNRRD